MTTREARRALSEMVMTESLDKEHAKEVEHMLNKADGYWFPEWDIYLPYGTGESD